MSSVKPHSESFLAQLREPPDDDCEKSEEERKTREMLSEFVLKGTIKTRPLAARKLFGQPQYEDVDNGSKDITVNRTLLRSSSVQTTGFHVGASDNGYCKEEMDMKEAEPPSKAMEHQSPIAGLTPVAEEESIPTSIAPGKMDASSFIKTCNGNLPFDYKEGLHWIKGQRLGAGAFGICYKATDIKTGYIMAVKEILLERHNRDATVKQLEKIMAEVKIMTKLDNLNVVRCLWAKKEGYHINIFMECLLGGSVSDLLKQDGPFTESVVINYTIQILRGLTYIHENRIIHRDIKGANLFVSGRLLKIGDFGVSAQLASEVTKDGEFNQTQGTYNFMAPEVITGKSYGRACDVWSTGCVLIEMTMGQPPWYGTYENLPQLIYKIGTSKGPPPIPDEVSPPMRNFMLKCMTLDPKHRPSTKDLLKDSLFTNNDNDDNTYRECYEDDLEGKENSKE